MCKSCEALRINGILCHEAGCPDSWTGKPRECKECGSRFEMEHAMQLFCSNDCYAMYYGMATESETRIDGTTIED
jgi:hypothetical protein